MSEQENTRSETHKGQMDNSCLTLNHERREKLNHQQETGQETAGVSGLKKKKKVTQVKAGDMVNQHPHPKKDVTLGQHRIPRNPLLPPRRKKEKSEECVSMIKPRKICVLNYILKSFIHIFCFSFCQILSFAKSRHSLRFSPWDQYYCCTPNNSDHMVG